MVLKRFPEDRSVHGFVRAWKEENGRADPRPMLDSYFWSGSLGRRYIGAAMIDIDAWCDSTVGQDNWYRLYNKIWFTSEHDMIMYNLTWGGRDDG